MSVLRGNGFSLEWDKVEFSVLSLLLSEREESKPASAEALRAMFWVQA